MARADAATPPPVADVNAARNRYHRASLDMHPGGLVIEYGEDDRARALLRKNGVSDPILAFEKGVSNAVIEFVTFCFDDMNTVLRAIEAQHTEIMHLRSQVNNRRRDADFAANCAIICNEPPFRQFLIDQHGLRHDAARGDIAVRLRSILKIKSRADLNKDQAAATRWQRLRADYQNWKG